MPSKTHLEQRLLKAVAISTVPLWHAVPQLPFVIRSGREYDAPIRTVTS